MKIHTTPMILGSGSVEVTVPAPRIDFGVFHRLSLVFRGFLDALRYRGVIDENHTHYLHGLMSQCRRGEQDVVSAVDRSLAAVRGRLARARLASAQRPSEELPEPGITELANLAGADRQLWVQRVREARRAQERAESSLAAAEDAAELAVTLEAEAEAIAIEGADIRQMWSEAFEHRAAVYTRSRFGWIGRRPGELPRVPEYLPVGMKRELGPGQDLL